MANTYRKRSILAACATVLTVALFVFLLSGGLAKVKAVAQQVTGHESVTTNPDRVHYYAYDTLEDLWHFGPDAYTEANGQLSAIYQVDDNGKVTGSFIERMRRDPALTAAIAVDILNRGLVDDWSTILGTRAAEFKDVPIGRLADQLHTAFLEDYTFWDAVIANIFDFLKQGEAEIVELDGYTSSMYMLKDGLQGNKPSVVVRNTQNAGGHMLVFKFGAGSIMLRLECGFQPVNPHEYWPTPDSPGTPPIQDNPTPPKEDTPPPETPPLEPKKVDAGPQAVTGGSNPDYGGTNSRNENIDTRVTPEPQSPPSYTAPPAPTTSSGGGSGGSGGGGTTTHNSGGTETYNGKDYEVVTGNTDSYTDLGTVQENASHETVETPVQNDGVNTGDIDAPE